MAAVNAKAANEERTSRSIYTHLRLGNVKRCIRLLSIDKLDRDGTIHCSLRVLDLDKRPHYCALSYTWRNPLGLKTHRDADDKLQTIRCNDRRLKVLPNLLAALETIATSKYRHEPFWIDALCIDQEGTIDASEKAGQLSIMPLIYRAADTVLVFLGPEDEDSKRALPLIDRLASLTLEQRHKVLPSTLAQNTATLRQWRSLARFLCRSYFSRAWVVQEVMHAATVAAFCGDVEIDWLDIVKISEMLSTTDWNNIFHRESFRGSDLLYDYHGGPAKIRASKFQRALEQDNVLLYSLIRSRNYECGDPKDKIFSIVSASRQAFTIDYSLPAETIYTEAAKAILLQRDDLLLLGHAEGKDYRKIGTMPSWVPDWSVTDTVGLGITGYKRYYAAPTKRFEPVLDVDVLRVSAEYVSRIAKTGESKAAVLKGEAPVEWLRILGAMDDDYTPTVSVFEAFWRVLLNDTGLDGVAPDELGECFVHWFARLLQPHMKKGSPSAIRQFLLKLERKAGFNVLAKPFDIDQGKADRFEASYGHNQCLRPFVTDAGMLGAGTTSCRRGDDVYLVHGSRIPLILRKRGAAYELVGGCYLHGAMHGELIGRTEVQELRIE